MTSSTRERNNIERERIMSYFNMNSLGDLMAHSENEDLTSIGFEEQDAVAKDGNKIEAVEVPR
jgi:hypothetical protein